MDLRDKLNNYSVPPPEGVWEDIASKLDAEQSNVKPLVKRKRTYYFMAAAAGIVVIIACFALFTILSNSKEKQVVSSMDSTKVQGNELAKNNEKPTNQAQNESLMRVPDKDVVKSKDHTVGSRNNTPAKKVIQEKKEVRETSIPDSSVNKERENNNYITIAGPEDQPVKISAKAAALIESSDRNNPPHTVWNKKINKWRDIMKSNTLAPTPGNFLDIVELNNTLVDKNHP
jgi:hypothetical protein